MGEDLDFCFGVQGLRGTVALIGDELVSRQ